MFGQLPVSPEEQARQKVADYKKGRSKIYLGSHAFMFGITVAAIGGMLAQIYAAKVLRKEKLI